LTLQVIGTWITARDGQTVFISDNVELVYGYTPDEILSAGEELWFGRIHPKDRDRVQEAFEALFSEQRDFKIEYRIQRKDGEWLWLLDSANMVKDEKGQQLAYGVFTDITERKQAEDTLQESEAQFRAAAMATSDLIWESDHNADTLEWFGDVDSALGYEVSEFPRTIEGWMSAIHTDDRDRVSDLYKKCLSSGDDFYAEYRIHKKDGSILLWEDRGKTSKITNGKVVKSVGAITDITYRKQAEDELRMAKEYAESLIETANAMVIVLDKDGNITVFNKAAEEITGYSQSELLNRNWFEVVVPKERFPEVWEEFERLIAGGTPKNFENPILTKSGQERYIVWKNNELKDDGQVAGTISFGIDITERKQAEEQLQRISQDENKRRQELEKLREISASMRQAEGSSNLLQVFTSEVQAFCRSDITSSILFKAPDELITCFAPKGNKKLSGEKTKAITKALLNAKTGELIARIPGFESVFILPLQSSDMVYGAVMAASQIPDAFTPDEQNMLNAIADMAGTALHRIDILETLEERVERRTHDLVVLYNLITIISENWQLQDLLELSLVLTLETLKAERGIIYLSDRKDIANLKPVVQRGFTDGFQIEIDSLPEDKLARKVFKGQKPLAFENLEDNSDNAAFKGMNSCVGIPIMTRGDVRGVFCLFANEKGVFGSDEMALLASIADHLAIGIENSILFEQSRENAALEERNRLARNLHDSVSQLLYSLTLMAGTTKKMLERDVDLVKVANSVERLGYTAHQALKEMRLLVYELRPAVLDSEGLGSALQHRIETVEERLGVKVALQAGRLPELPNYVEDALYHIALEALNNIVKHSESKNASIKFTSKRRNISMQISDEGKGFDTSQTHTGLGLRNMRERAQMLEGEISIESTPGDGTQVTVKVKIPSDSRIAS